MKRLLIATAAVTGALLLAGTAQAATASQTRTRQRDQTRQRICECTGQANRARTCVQAANGSTVRSRQQYRGGGAR